MTTEQAAQIPEALARAQAFAEANGLRTNLTDYMKVREDHSRGYELILYTTDRYNEEVDVSVILLDGGGVSEAQGFDRGRSYA
jgi:hypothetical protein